MRAARAQVGECRQPWRLASSQCMPSCYGQASGAGRKERSLAGRQGLLERRNAAVCCEKHVRPVFCRRAAHAVRANREFAEAVEDSPQVGPIIGVVRFGVLDWMPSLNRVTTLAGGMELAQRLGPSVVSAHVCRVPRIQELAGGVRRTTVVRRWRHAGALVFPHLVREVP